MKKQYLLIKNGRIWDGNKFLSDARDIAVYNGVVADIGNFSEQSADYILDAKGGVFGSYTSELVTPSSGESIELTIDYEIQSIMERELNNAYLKYEPQSIYGIAMDPNNGEILAISNYPNYNPNNYKEYSQELINRNLPVW